MGLAASQGRLLTITGRKADCEFQSMKLSHEKIALSRDMERISDEYQKAMNKTKLVYDYYGSGTSDMALNYNLLMTPSVYNDYYPKLLTDNKNRIVLSGPYASAAAAAGIPKEGFSGTPSSVIRNAFVEALLDNHVITAATATNIESVSYNNAIGLGATFIATEATQDITYDDLKEMVKSYCIDTSDYGLRTNYKHTDNENNLSAYPNSSLLSRDADGQTFRLALGTGSSDDMQVSSINLYDLLFNEDKNHQYTVSLETGKGATIAAGEFAFLQQWLIGTEGVPSFLNWMLDQFSEILGGVKENDQALQYAYDQVYDLMYPNERIQDLGTTMINNRYQNCTEAERGKLTAKITDGGEYKSYKDNFLEIGTKVNNNYDGIKSNAVRSYASKYLGAVFNSCDSGSTSWVDGGGGRRQCVAINLNNIAKAFLTAFQEYRTGADGSKYAYNVGKIDEENRVKFYKPESDDIFTVTAPLEINDGSGNLNVGFYDALFNRICVSGWTENDNITDVQYMQELLKNGAVFISSIDNDGNYYQNSYSTDTYIAEVADTEGIARAESEYNAKKAQIESKENTIDMKMKNLDTEISSLTTEYDTMKSLISKTIEKSFKRYDA